MKLKTVCRETRTLPHPLRYIAGTYAECQIDVAAAHALVEALSLTEINGWVCARDVFERADDLMREWGFVKP